MTETQLREKVANFLNDYKGLSEGGTLHKKLLAFFNDSGLCTRYKMTTSDAWCATAVSATFIALGLAGKAGAGKLCEFVECSCAEMVAKAKTQGIWTESDSITPKVGDVIMYDWQDSGSGDNTGAPDHVGIVQKVSGSTLTIIEGNKNDTVALRTLQVNGKYIRGYIQPKYNKFATSSTSADSGSTAAAGSTGSAEKTSTGLNKISKWTGTVTASSLNVRTWAGTENKTCSFSPLKKGAKISVCDSVKASDGSTWYYIKYNSKYGFVHSAYVSK